MYVYNQKPGNLVGTHFFLVLKYETIIIEYKLKSINQKSWAFVCESRFHKNFFEKIYSFYGKMKMKNFQFLEWFFLPQVKHMVGFPRLLLVQKCIWCGATKFQTAVKLAARPKIDGFVVFNAYFLRCVSILLCE